MNTQEITLNNIINKYEEIYRYRRGNQLSDYSHIVCTLLACVMPSSQDPEWHASDTSPRTRRSRRTSPDQSLPHCPRHGPHHAGRFSHTSGMQCRRSCRQPSLPCQDPYWSIERKPSPIQASVKSSAAGRSSRRSRTVAAGRGS